MLINLSSFFCDIQRILKALPPRLRLRTMGIFSFMVVQSFLELGFILTLTYLGTALADSEGLRNVLLFRGIFYIFPDIQNWAMDKRNLLLLAGFVVVAFSILKNIINYWTTKSIALLGEDISYSFAKEILRRFLYRSYAWHLSPESEQMYQRMLWRGNVTYMLTNLLSMYACILTLLTLFLGLVSQEPMLTTIVVVIVGSVGFILYRTIRHHVDRNAYAAAESATAETRALLCATKGIREVLIYRQQTAFLSSLAQAAIHGRAPRTFLGIAATLPTWILEATGFIVVIIAIAYLVYIQQADIPRLTSALALLMLTAWRVLPYCNRVVSHQVVIRSVRPMSNSVLELLENLRDSPSEAPPEPSPNFHFDKVIRLNNVYFRYPNASHDSLDKINIELHKGNQIGIIGASGAGKSTLVGVLSGLLPPTRGRIEVDGHALTPVRAAAFATQIGYVPQNPFLFAGTLAENIAFSHWGKPWDEKRVRDACHKASIDFIDSHPAGLNQPIGENGAGLSGGQAQRVSIARAMYTRPGLLIFDEATSALDQANENSIQRIILELTAEVTCVIIAHRLTTIKHCHSLIWLENGKVKMQGPTEKVLSLYQSSQHSAN